MIILRSVAMLVLVSAVAGGQTYSDQGMLGASGIVLFPTATIAPKAQFRVHAGRMTLLSGQSSGVTVIGMSGGLSSHVEAYVRLLEDQTASSGAATSYGFGMKLQIPAAVPGVEQLSLWGESVTSESMPVDPVYPTGVVRAGMTALLLQNGVRPHVLLAAAFRDHRTTACGGAGITVAMSHAVQVGAELLYGYAGARSTHAMGSGSIRIFSGVCLQVGGGYLRTPDRGTALISVGLSVGTADVDFAPVVEEKRPDFTMPSLEEMEQESREEEKQ